VKRIRRTEVTVETDEIMIIRCSRGVLAHPCAECPETGVMITPEQAAMMIGTNIRAIFRWLEAGRVHYSETPEGSLLVCPDSILKLTGKISKAD